MKKPTPILFALLCLLLLTFSCGPLKSGYNAFKKENYEKAQKKLESVAPDSLSSSSKTYCYETASGVEDEKVALSPKECIAAYYLNKIELRNAVSTSRLLTALSDYSILEKQVNGFSL